ncbi:MAG: hypothetical protein KC505_07915 [Myxococcales bacterium]|nr:hypothetical protein [Myxococcales bacterium]USN51837.1 MAG: hypothetical protein H6731_05370 [Myxococcales bacterium]
MFKFSQNFIKNIEDIFGKSGREWLNSLPKRIKNLEEVGELVAEHLDIVEIIRKRNEIY